MIKLKIVMGVMILAFIGVLVGIVGIEATVRPTKAIFKEIHEISGMIFIAMIFVHMFMNRKALKAIFRLRRKKAL
ncbi:MAG: hypothetical protein IKD08_06120 [Alphaproteobacteria bacterium]|nr:hypothetical protein [Alphaproteobacteria bacterium]